MQDTNHLVALQVRLSHERDYLAKAKSTKEKQLRTVWIAQIQKEISDEMKFLGISEELPEISTDDLLAELLA